MEQNKDLTALKDRLSQIQKEQTEIKIFLMHHQFSGVVIRIENECIDLRVGGEKIMIRLRDVCAIQFK